MTINLPLLAASLMTAGMLVTLVGLVGHTLVRPQFGWPEPRVQGIYTVWVASHGPLHQAVLRPDWEGIRDFFVSWTTLLISLALLFALGMILHAYIFQALASIYFAPNWRPQCAA